MPIKAERGRDSKLRQKGVDFQVSPRSTAAEIG